MYKHGLRQMYSRPLSHFNKHGLRQHATALTLLSHQIIFFLSFGLYTYEYNILELSGSTK